MLLDSKHNRCVLENNIIKMLSNPYKILFAVSKKDKDRFKDLEKALKKEGYQPQIVYSKKDALDFLKQENNVNLSFIDKDMPGNQGRDLFFRVEKEHPGLATMIMASEFPDNEKRSYTEAGMNAYINKPVTSRNLINLIDRYVRFSNKDIKQVLIAGNNGIPEQNNMQEYQVRTTDTEKSIFEKIMNNNFGVIVLDREHYKDSVIQIAKRIKDFRPYVNLLVRGREETSDEMTKLKHLIDRRIIFDYVDAADSNLAKKVDEAFEDRDYRINWLNQDQEASPNLWAIIGPRAAGKTVTVDDILYSLPCTYKFIRHTARLMRPMEINGEDHKFVNENYFELCADKFMYTFKHKGAYTVGFEKHVIDEQLEKGKEVILTLANLDSFFFMKDMYPDMKSILINIDPEISELRSKKRGGSVQTLEQARKEYELFDSHDDYFDFTIWNRSNSLGHGSKPYNPSEKQISDLEKRGKLILKIIRDERFINRSFLI